MVYVNNAAQTPVYYDNLVVMQSTGNVIEVNAYYPYGKIIQGLSTSSTYGKNNYKYNGKELQTDMDLNRLDYGARVLPTEHPVWFVPDPLAEKYYSYSPYVYCGNNPINLIDVDGMYWETDRDEKEAKQQRRDYMYRIMDLSAQRGTIVRQIDAVKNNSSLTDNQRSAQLAQSNNQSSDTQAQYNDIQAAVSELDAMGAATDMSFTFNKVDGQIVTIEHGTNSRGHTLITINHLGTFGNKSHELKHGHQVLMGKIVPDARQSNKFNYKQDYLLLESQAYQRQYSTDGPTSLPNSDARSIKKIGDIDIGWVAVIYYYNRDRQKTYPYSHKGNYSKP